MRGVIHGINKNSSSIPFNLNRCSVNSCSLRAWSAYCYNSKLLGYNGSVFAYSEVGGVSG